MTAKFPTYELIDSGNLQKLEQVGPFRIARPAAQAVWQPSLAASEWQGADATFRRTTGGDGDWHIKNKRIPASWQIQINQLRIVVRLTDFGHLGIFPEQLSNWIQIDKLVRSKPGMMFANLFAYTGVASLIAARAGAKVIHLDASKTSVAWARENAEACQLTANPIRWLVEDVTRFISREVRRGARYHGISLDPPSFGRGPKGELWKIEDHMNELLSQLGQVMAEDFRFILLSSHSPGFTPLALKNLLLPICNKQRGTYQCEEMVIREKSSGRVLPSGAYCLFSCDK